MWPWHFLGHELRLLKRRGELYIYSWSTWFCFHKNADDCFLFHNPLCWWKCCPSLITRALSRMARPSALWREGNSGACRSLAPAKTALTTVLSSSALIVIPWDHLAENSDQRNAVAFPVRIGCEGWKYASSRVLLRKFHRAGQSAFSLRNIQHWPITVFTEGATEIGRKRFFLCL